MAKFGGKIWWYLHRVTDRQTDRWAYSLWQCTASYAPSLQSQHKHQCFLWNNSIEIHHHIRTQLILLTRKSAVSTYHLFYGLQWMPAHAAASVTTLHARCLVGRTTVSISHAPGLAPWHKLHIIHGYYWQHNTRYHGVELGQVSCGKQTFECGI